MAATGYTPIYLYYSGTATHIPLAANLGNGELAINAADGNLFYKNTSNAVVTIPVLQSSSTQSGWLSSTDWTTFNSKQPAGAYLTSVTADSPLTGAGTSASHLSMPAATGSVNGYLTSTDWTTFNSKQPAGTYVTSVSGTSPIASSGGTTPTISLGTVPIANGGTNNTSYTAKSGNVAGLVFYDGSKLANDATVTDVGYDTSANQFIAKSISLTDDVDRYTAYAYNTKSSGFNYALNFIKSDQNTSNDSFRAISYYNGGANEYRFYVTDAGQIWTKDNLVIGTSGKGIDFSATAGTGTSELLADYEEGTWTPAITFSVSNGDLSYATQSGFYTKIGRCVTFEVILTFGETTASGYITQISGLPYTSAASTSAGGGAYVDNMSGLTGAGTWVLGASSTALNLYFSGTGSVGVISNTNTGAASNVIRIAGFYYTI